MFYKVVVGIISFVLRIVYRVEVIGLENVPKEGAYLMAANHKHVLDPFFLAIAARHRQVNMVAKKELFKNPILAKLLTMAGVISINRDKPELSTIRAVINVLKGGNVIGIFPEGTRIKDKDLGEAKTGIGLFVAKGKADVIPTAIISNYKLFSKLKIVFGKPMDMSSYYIRKVGAKEYETISHEIMEKIGELYYSDENIYLNDK